MIAVGLAAILAAAQPPPPVGSSSASLAVSATIVRPAQLSEPVATAEGAAVVIRNTDRVAVSLDGRLVRQTDPGATIVELDGSAAHTITLTY